MGRVDVIRAQRAKLLATQAGVVGQPNHEPVANRLSPRRGQDRQPVLVIRYPGLLVQLREQASLWRTLIGSLPASTTDGIPRTNALLQQIVVEEPHGDQSQLQSCIR